MNSHDPQRVKAVLLTHLSALGLIIDQHIQFPGSFPYAVLGRHVVALGVDGDVRINERGITANVLVSIQALLAPRIQAGQKGERPTEVKEFKGTVQFQAIGTQITDFGDLEFVPPAMLLSWPDDLII